MIIVDSCGWLEWFTDGKLANSYKEFLASPDKEGIGDRPQ